MINPRLPALLYHDVIAADQHAGSGFPGPVAARYKLDPQHFDAHLTAVRQRLGPTARAVIPEQVLEDASVATGSVLFTFDDGGASSLTIADRLEQHGFRGVFFVNTALLDQPSFLRSTDLQALVSRGHSIGTHSHSHPPEISRLSDDALLEEWTVSKTRLEDILGGPVISGSVPGGYFSSRVAAAARTAGLRVLFTSEPTATWVLENGLWLAGRYSIVRDTPTITAAALAANDPFVCWKLACLWRVKKLAKFALGGAYRAVSRRYWQHVGR